MLALALAVLAASTRGDLDSVVLADGTVLRGLVIACAEQIRFLPRGTDPEILLDRDRVRSVTLTDGARCTAVPRMAPSAATLAPALPPPPTTSRWYGAPLVVSDVAAVALGSASVATGIDRSTTAGLALGIPAAALYLVTPAVVHGIYGSADRAFFGVALRVGLPLLGYFAGRALGGVQLPWQEDPPAESTRRQFGFVLGGLGAFAAALADDATAFESTAGPFRAARNAGPSRGTGLCLRF